MKQNVVTNILYASADTAIAVLLYIVFPIIPLYVFITLLALVMASSASGSMA
ncbi:hypothetical protein [Vulcanisaeta distributa]|uniref:hypothetical protein n=1 Tax=Vulcanisaeta distributa TaxID=164451 RepID=UPI001FB2B78E|nr:hypothetical protein [Vulcanisaeta distributa]